MLSSSSAIQDRRTAKSGTLAINASHSTGAQRPSLPPLKSPRGHLLDRIRSTPRSTGFVPQSAPPTEDLAHGTDTMPQRDFNTLHTPQCNSRVPSSKPSGTYNASDFARSKVNNERRQQKSDPAHADQMVMLEQQLRAQTDLLTQQQTLLRHLQQQYNGPSHYASPPYTPQSVNSRYAQAKPLQHDIVSTQNVAYDPATGQYYAFTPHQMNLVSSMQPNFAYNITPPQKPQYAMNTPESIPQTKAYLTRSPLPPKEGQPSRQPKGPPAIETLLADSGRQLNFGARSRKRSAKILEAGLLRRRNSPAPSEAIPRAPSRASTRSNASLGPIEEAFPAMQLN